MKGAPESLLAAASAVFAQKGFQDANVAEICRKAGVNIAAISYYFGGKKKLYINVLDHAFAVAEQEFPLCRAAAGAICPRERLAAFILAQFRRTSCDGPAGHFSRILVHEMTNPSFAHEQIIQKNIAPLRDYLDGLLREILPVGIREEYIWVCHFNIVSLFSFPMIMRTVHHPKRKKHMPPPPQAEEMARSATLFAFGGIDAIILAAGKGDAPPAMPPPPDHSRHGGGGMNR